MSPLDEAFKSRLHKIVSGMHGYLQAFLEKGLKQGELKPGVQTEAVAWFILASLEGSFSMGKTRGQKEVFDMAIACLLSYMDSLADTK
jgi:TetR/AcrR family transcriptional repressor of nem operon